MVFFKESAGGYHHALFLDCKGSVWSCGYNLNRWQESFFNVWVCGRNKTEELGVDHTTKINSPQKNKNLSGIVAVAGRNAYFSMFLNKQEECGRRNCSVVKKDYLHLFSNKIFWKAQTLFARGCFYVCSKKRKRSLKQLFEPNPPEETCDYS